ncbi:MAG: glutaredoxin 3 [Oceanospirillaceae bacterium]
MPNIEIYTTKYCPFCVRAKMLLTQKGVTFIEHAVDRDPDLRKTMMQLSDGAHTVPQIFIDDKHIGGCDELYALERQSQLDKILSL